MVLVVLVGLPAAGKSTFARTVQENFPEVQVICADEHHGSSDPGMLRCRSQAVLDTTRSYLKKDYSVIIDDTMHLRAMRKPFIGLCQELQIPLIFVWIAPNAQIEWHLARNEQRAKPVPAEHIVRMADKFDSFKTNDHLYTISYTQIDTLNIRNVWPVIVQNAKIPKMEVNKDNINAVESDSHKLYLLLNRGIHAFVMEKPCLMREQAARYANSLKKEFLERSSSFSLETAEHQFKAILFQGDPSSNE